MKLALLAALAWLNTPFPLTTEVLKGKVIVVVRADDSTLEGRRALRSARRLDARFQKGLAVIALWPATAESARPSVLRRDLAFPVAADPSAGKTIESFVFDAAGVEAARFDGMPLDAVAERVSGLFEGARKAGLLDESPLPLRLERDAAPKPALLAYPAGLAYDSKTKTLWVADSGNHRLLALSSSGKLRSVVGAGFMGARDGDYGEAAFDRPVGAAFGAGAAFLSDEGNETVRRVDLAQRRVSSVMTGKGAFAPLGLLFHDDMLFAANPAGHEVSSARFPGGGRRARFAGTGEAGSADGSLASATFGAPAAVAESGGKLWIADGAALRVADLQASHVSTPELTGAPLSRPSAIAGDGGGVLVADAGDGTLKRVAADGKVSVLASGLSQPSGVVLAGAEIVVADTGRSRLLRFAKDGKPLGELKVTGLKPQPKAPPIGYLPEREEEEPPRLRVAKSGEIALQVAVEAPEGWMLNPRGPFTYRVGETRGRVSFVESTRKGQVVAPRKPVTLRFTPSESVTEALLEADFHFCRLDGTGPSRSASKRYRLIFEAVEGGPKTVRFVAKP